MAIIIHNTQELSIEHELLHASIEYDNPVPAPTSLPRSMPKVLITYYINISMMVFPKTSLLQFDLAIPHPIQ